MTLKQHWRRYEHTLNGLKCKCAYLDVENVWAKRNFLRMEGRRRMYILLKCASLLSSLTAKKGQTLWLAPNLWVTEPFLIKILNIEKEFSIFFPIYADDSEIGRKWLNRNVHSFIWSFADPIRATQIISTNVNK